MLFLNKLSLYWKKQTTALIIRFRGKRNKKTKQGGVFRGYRKICSIGIEPRFKIARFAKGNPEVELAAVAGFGDSDFQIANELGVPLFSDYTLLFKQIPLDAVYIALPNTLHVEAVENAIEAGIKNILLEKPIANTVEEGKHVIEVCKKAGVNLLIGHHRRSSSKYQFLREVIDSGRLGKIVTIHHACIAKRRGLFRREWYVTKKSRRTSANQCYSRF